MRVLLLVAAGLLVGACQGTLSGPDETADLLPVKIGNFPGAPGWCSRAPGNKMRVRVRNLGPLGSAQTKVHIKYDYRAADVPSDTDVPPLPSGGEATVLVTIPPQPGGTGDFDFIIKVTPVSGESSTANNTAHGRCIN